MIRPGKIVALVLAVSFLLSGLGFTANRMTCLKSGKTKYSFVAIRNCCPPVADDQDYLRQECCDVLNSSFELSDYNQSAAQPDFKIPVVTIPGYVLPDFSTRAIVCSDLPLIADHPPSDGRSLLTLNSVFRI